MPAYQLIVFTNCTAGADAAFNRWYDEVHIPDVLAVPGFTGATRLRFADPPDGEAPEFRYCAIYDMESEDPGATIAALTGRAGSDLMKISATLDEAVRMHVWEVITPRVEK